MKIMFNLNGVDHEGIASQLSTQGIFVACSPVELPARLALHLDTEGRPLIVAGEVVRVVEEGFALAFEPLNPKTFSRLNRLVKPNLDTAASKHSQASESKPELKFLTIEGKEWTPPVTEPTLHEWKPSTDLVPPPIGNLQEIDPEHPGVISAIQTADEQTITRESPAGANQDTVAETTQESVSTNSAAEPPEPTAASEPATRATSIQDERRRNQRVQKSIPVTFENVTSLIKEFTHNISFGGLFVYTHQPFKRDQMVSVTLIHPVNGNRIDLEAKVVHSGSATNPDPATGAKRYGVGVEFIMPLGKLKQALSDFITSHQQQEPPEEIHQLIEQAREIHGKESRAAHELLGVHADASREEVRSVYFMLVDRFHPDRFYGKVSSEDQKLLEDLFRSLTKAYEELMR